ncbi:TPA: P-loop NTPase fold protein [Photobacterium damselae]
MDIEEFDSSFCEYLENENEKVLLVKGRWGIGKTYYINKSLEKNKEKYKYIKISLFGIGNIDELSKAVSDSLINNILPIINKFTKIVASVPFIANYLPRELPSLDEISIDSSITRLIIFFDDIERMELGLVEFFGYVDRIKNSSPFKIVIALNDEQLNTQDIWKLKEKVTDKEIRLQNTIEHVIGSIFNQDYELALNTFRLLRIVNLRVIIKSSKIMNLFIDKSKELDMTNLNKLKVSCLCLSAKYYASEDFDGNLLDHIGWYDRNFPFNSLINSYLDSQIFTNNLFDQINNNIVNSQITNNNDKSFNLIFQKYNNTFESNADEILILCDKFINKQLLNESQIISIVTVINNLNGSISHSQIKHWFNNKERSRWFVQSLLDIFKEGDTHKEILKYQTQDMKNSKNDDSDIIQDETSIFINSCLQQAYNSSIEFFEDDLSIYSKDIWLNYIINYDPIDLFRRFQDGIIKFIEDEKGKNLKQALIEFSAEPIQRMRLINIFGDRINDILKHQNN